MKNKIGIVFGGGGGKGAYQIGVWKALDELGVCDQIKGVSGASVGALNGSLFYFSNLERALSAWSGISETSILTRKDVEKGGRAVKVYRNGIAENGWFSNKGLKEMITKYVDISAVKKKEIVFYVAVSRVKKPAVFYNYIKKFSEKNILHKIISAFLINIFKWFTEPCYFKIDHDNVAVVKDIILASAAIPLVFPDIKIKGELYVDGGLKDNVPILPLYNAGFRKILIVDLDAEKNISVYKFPGVKFLRLSLKEESELTSLTDTFDFTAEDAKIKINQGYGDCMSISDTVLEFFNE